MHRQCCSFTALMETTQRSESMNTVVKMFLNLKSSLTDLFHELCQRQLEHREKSLILDKKYLESFTFKGPFHKALDLVQQMCSMTILSAIEEQINRSLLYNAPELLSLSFELPTPLKELTEGVPVNEWRCFRIWYISEPNKISYVLILCDSPLYICGEIIRAGYPCRHCRRIFFISHSIRFHSSMINKRWRLVSTPEKTVTFKGESESTARLLDFFINTLFASDSPNEEEEREIARLKREIHTIMQRKLASNSKSELIQLKETLISLNSRHKPRIQERKETTTMRDVIRPPSVLKRKGRPAKDSKNRSSQLADVLGGSKKRKGPLTCSMCGDIGHKSNSKKYARKDSLGKEEQ